METSRPKAVDLVIGTGWLSVGMWHAADGEELLGSGFALLGLAAFAAAFLPRVHEVMYGPNWRRRTGRRGRARAG